MSEKFTLSTRNGHMHPMIHQTHMFMDKKKLKNGLKLGAEYVLLLD